MLQTEQILKRLSELVDSHAAGKPTLFAKNAGIHHSTFLNYMKGRMPSAEHLCNIRNTYNVNIDWILTGEGPKYAEGAGLTAGDLMASSINDKVQAYSPREIKALDPDPELNDLLKKTRDVLVSKTSYAESLRANVNSFHESVKAREHIQNMQSQINELKQYIMTDRRRGDRRIDTTPGSGNDLVDKLKGAHDRRSGPDRRKSGLGK